MFLSLFPIGHQGGRRAKCFSFLGLATKKSNTHPLCFLLSNQPLPHYNQPPPFFFLLLFHFHEHHIITTLAHLSTRPHLIEDYFSSKGWRSAQTTFPKLLGNSTKSKEEQGSSHQLLSSSFSCESFPLRWMVFEHHSRL